MLTVKTSLRHSAIHGMGVFAEQFIAAGTVVWQFQPEFDFRVSEESVAALPEIARQKLLHYSAKWGGGYVISADDARFLNHSEAPNLRTMDEPDCDIAIRDILIGEELFEDYREFDDTFAGRPIDLANARVLELEEDASTVAHLRTVLQKVRESKGAGAHFTDSEVAGQIRMLERGTLGHEMVCVMARDRIIALADEVDSLRRERDASLDIIARQQSDTLSLTAERDAAIEAGKAETALFAWLSEKQYDLHTHRELSQLDNQYFIWWTVIDRRNKLSLSHPYGSPQDAIRAAMQAAQVEKP